VSATQLVVVWRITEACDLGCHFCAYSRHLRRSRAAADAKQVLAFGEVLREYARADSREVLVSWLGGEPLRWLPVWELSRTFAQEFGLRVGATTNGTAIKSAEARQRLVDDFAELTISMDGLGPIHDELRGAPDLFEQLRASLKSLRDLKSRLARGPRLHVNTILMRDNIFAFEDLCREVAGWGVEQLTYNALGGRDRLEFYPNHGLRPEDVAWFRRALPGIRERMAKLGLTILGSELYLRRLEASARNYHLPITDCHPGQHFLFVDEHGFVSPCSYTTQGYSVHLSELCTPEDLRRLPARFAERRRQRRLGPCLDCPSTQVFGKFEPTSVMSSKFRQRIG
jgi:MoaA/NifB/PqqE/SkfB family radical SAM enzyme